MAMLSDPDIAPSYRGAAIGEIPPPAPSREIKPTTHLVSDTLPCGIRYYILPHDKPKDAVELRLLVRVGSIMEDEDERGLAHFLEHMGFKGTENYAQYELVKQLQTLGISYGPDLNASTNQLETSYQLSTTLTEDLSKLRTALTVLREWAFYMRISELDVTEEKSVINAEYQSKQGVSQRLLHKYWASIFDSGVDDVGNRIARRMPIGIPEVFLNTSASKIKHFYEKWYHPDNMAILVVGDFAPRIDTIRSLVHDIFACVTPRDGPVFDQSLRHLKLPTHHCSDSAIALHDKELTLSQLSFEFFLPCPSEPTYGFLKADIVRRLICSVVDRRLHMIWTGNCPFYGAGSDSSSNNSTPPFIAAGISMRQIVRGLMCIGLTVTVPPGADASASIAAIDTAIRALLLEMKRFEVHGITDAELHTAKHKWEMYFAEQRDHSTVDSRTIVSDLSNHVLCDHKTIFEHPKIEASIALECMHSLTKKDLEAGLSCLDMHLDEKASQMYYGSVDCGRFRVICSQIPTKKDDEVRVSEDDLMSSLRRIRAEVGGITPEPWSSVTQLLPADIFDAAHLALYGPDQSIARVASSDSTSVFARRRPSSTDLDLMRSSLHPALDSGCMPGCSCCAAVGSLTSSSAAGPLLCAEIPTSPATAASDASKVVQEEVFESINVHRVTLSNGIQVLLRWMPKGAPNKISMQGFALGGGTELTEAEEHMMCNLDSIAEQSGYRGRNYIDDEPDSSFSLSGIEVVNLQSSMKTYVNTQRHFNHRGIGGSCPASNFELMLAFTALKLTSQHISKAVVEKTITSLRTRLEHQHQTPDEIFMERSRVLTCGDVDICRPYNLQVIDQLTDELAERIYSKAFLRDPTEFLFVMVGDLPSMSEVKLMLDEYLGHLKPNEEIKSRYGPWVNQSPDSTVPFTRMPGVFPSECISETMCLRKAEKSSVILAFRHDVNIADAAMRNINVLLDGTCRAVEIKLLDYLRIQLGKVYNVVVDYSRNSLGEFSLISIGFHCDKNDCNLIEEAVLSVLELLKQEGPSQESLDGIRESSLKAFARDAESSSHWLFWILESAKDLAFMRHCAEATGGEDAVAALPSLETLVCRRSINKPDIITSTLTVDVIRESIRECFGGPYVTLRLFPSTEAEAAI